MGLLDNLLLGGLTRERLVRKRMREAFTNSVVTEFSEKGVQFSSPDTSANTLGAQTAVAATTGAVPSSMLTKTSRFLPFADDKGTFQQLQQAGLGVGSSAMELSELLSTTGTSQGNKDAVAREFGPRNEGDIIPNTSLTGITLSDLFGQATGRKDKERDRNGGGAGHLSLGDMTLEDVLKVDSDVREGNDIISRLLNGPDRNGGGAGQ